MSEADGPGRRDGTGSPSFARRLGVVLLGLLLAVSLTATAGVLAAGGTVLDSAYVAERAEEADTAAALEERAEDRILEGVDTSLGGEGYIPAADATVEPTVRELITEEYVRGVVRRNLDRLYGFLHGDRERLALAVDTTPLIEDVRPTVREELATIPVVDLLGSGAFADAFSVPGYEVEPETLARAYENETVYRAQQERFRTLLEETPLTREDLNETVVANTESGVSDLPAYVQEPVFRLERTFVLGFTSDMPHGEFRSRVDAAQADLYDAIARLAEERIDEQVPDRIVLTEGLSERDRQAADRAAGTVQLVDRLGTVLPAVVVGLVLVIGFVTHSVSRTARTVGASALTVGVVGFVAVRLAESGTRQAVRDALADTEAAFLTDTVVAIADGFFMTLGSQFLVLGIAGVVLVVVHVLIDRRQPEAIPAGWR